MAKINPASLTQEIKQAQKGDREAFQRVISVLSPRLYAVVFALYPNQDEVYDILQDVCIKAWQRLPQLRQAEAFQAWLMRIAVNTTRSRLSRRKEFPQAPDAAVFLHQTSASPDGDEVLSQEENRLLLQAALDHLSPEHREVVALVELEEMNCAEASRLLNCPAGTVRSRLFYARKQLRRFLQPYRQFLFQEATPRE